tara:strand:+ start:3948 stop:5243 length:1296 start_codon:yes stop_codon:yes gene_type:complete
MNSKQQLKKKILTKKAKVLIIGLGYVGLPLAIRLVKKKFIVHGIDKNKDTVSKLRNGISKLHYVNKKDLKYFKQNPKRISAEHKHVEECDVIIICLPTPLKGKNPDLSYLNNCYKSLSKLDLKNKLIILESTTYPETTKELFEKFFKNKFSLGKEIFIGYSPEREDPGRKINSYNVPKLVSGMTKNCQELVKLFYNNLVKKVVFVSNIETAELTKIYENTYRAVNIGLVNEMKVICDKLGLNIYEVIKAASTKPFGFTAFQPGPGFGGHCIPIDPFYLSWKIKKFGIKSNFINAAGEINHKMPQWIVNKVLKELKKKKINNNNILLLGVAYKKNISDTRESPAIEIINILEKKGYNVDYHDPYVKVLKNLRKFQKLKQSKKLNNNLKKYACILLVTDHDKVDYKKIVKNSRLIFDCRGYFRNIKLEKIINA